MPTLSAPAPYLGGYVKSSDGAVAAPAPNPAYSGGIVSPTATGGYAGDAGSGTQATGCSTCDFVSSNLEIILIGSVVIGLLIAYLVLANR